MRWAELPFREIWTLDFEFHVPPGGRPDPICMVACELRTGRMVRLWKTELRGSPPFNVDEHSLFVAYSASAELSCFLGLGWPMPKRVLDLYVEFRSLTNGLRLLQGRGLLGALSYHGIPAITAEEKHEGRALAIRGGPWTAAEQRFLMDYCETDVHPLKELLDRMLPAIVERPKGLGQALLRGRYMAAVARMEWVGVPIDTDTLFRLREQWPTLKQQLIDDVDRHYQVYEGSTFKLARFKAWVDANRIPWPMTASGQLALDQDTFHEQARIHPEVAPLAELRHAVSELGLEKLAVGADGRNRTALMPFGARTGRNTPSTNSFIFGPAVWLRGLIKPADGRVLAYVDWSSQEVAIAAALSGDEALLAAVESGDVYLSFAKSAGLAPVDATKNTHRAVRDLCKTCVLGTNYGMQAPSLAARTQQTRIAAQHLLDALARTFPRFWRWRQDVVDLARLTGQMSTVLGWQMRITDASRSTQLSNFPMQANAAEMLRLACCLATERGIRVCAPVHDALLIETTAADEEAAVWSVREAMERASELILGGLKIATEVDVVRSPQRYADPRGAKMWARVTALLQSQARSQSFEG